MLAILLLKTCQQTPILLVHVKIDANCAFDEMRRDDNESNNININV